MLRRLAWELERDDIDLIVSSSLVDTAGDRITVRPVDGLPMMHIEHPRLSGGRRLIKSRLRRRRSRALLLVLLAPVFLADRAGDQAGHRRAGLLPAGPGRPWRRDVPDVQVPHDARRRRGAAGGDARSSNEFAGVLFKIRDDPRVTRSGPAACAATRSTSCPS